jgi:formylglycine-generating enzyme required for sulfatase activity
MGIRGAGGHANGSVFGGLDPALQSDSGCMLDGKLDAIGWYCGNSDVPPYVPGAVRPQAVAQKRPNAFGLFDTSGNLFEWTNDRYNPYGYGPGPLSDLAA